MVEMREITDEKVNGAATAYFALAHAEESSEINYEEMQRSLKVLGLPPFASIGELENVYHNEKDWIRFARRKLVLGK